MTDKQSESNTKESISDQDKPVLRQKDRNLYKLVPVRLPVDKWDQFRKEADDLGIGSSTLARIWILDALRRLNGEAPDGSEYSRAKRKARSAKSRREAGNGHQKEEQRK